MRIRTNHKQTSYSRRNPYITPGKWYDVIHNSGGLYAIIDDDGMRIQTMHEGSAHLDFVGIWETDELV